MALGADHQSFPPTCGHDLHPLRFFFPTFDFEVFEGANMVNFDITCCRYIFPGQSTGLPLSLSRFQGYSLRRSYRPNQDNPGQKLVNWWGGMTKEVLCFV
ncbi:hypothetical protein DP117_24865 [Brasilonema sp. UFV-L1]|uniref:hypothetical protein n=1 Tax=Brasilonema sp. UFV-L1 TaxID=2234130 RepID=UPI00145F5A43|nr:hypothetical protein [Brasilonema sp. UFV-L1]NMG09943.1 hypothetical protein [Brasilonema sp. UFV-L1]